MSLMSLLFNFQYIALVNNTIKISLYTHQSKYTCSFMNGNEFLLILNIINVEI